MKQRVTLDSSAIEAVKYDEKRRTLDVEFREGHSYRYMHVPEFVYRELLKRSRKVRFGMRLRSNSNTRNWIGELGCQPSPTRQ
jgi:hypothetical protein